jgi:hypothetical protein
MAFARGRKAIGICDLCGTQWKLVQLKYGVVAGKTTRQRFCPDCWDPDNPRDRPSVWIAKGEAIAVRDPRPDPALAGLNSLGGWNPVLGEELPIFPVADGFVMEFVDQATPRYILTEDSASRLMTEDGSLIWADND